MRFLTTAYFITIAATAVSGNLLRGTSHIPWNEQTFDRTLSESNSTATCHEVGTYETNFLILGETGTPHGMVCAYPQPSNNDNETFPLLSFAHGLFGGGLGIFMYKRMLRSIASGGFVICAYVDCWTMCPNEWPQHQLDVLTAAKDIDIATPAIPAVSEIPEVPWIPETPEIDIPEIPGGETPPEILDLEILEMPDDVEIPEHLEKLPIGDDGDVGVIGYSSGGVSTLLCAMEATAHNYSIGGAVVYDGDYVSDFDHYNIGVDLGGIDPSLPLLLVASTETDPFGVPPQCQDDAKPNAEWLLQEHPEQPLIVACIDGMDHHDPVDHFFHFASLTAVPHIVAFFGHTLDPADSCLGDYERILGHELQSISSEHYFNSLF